jgi:flagellar basal body-associated protein FliL
VAHEQRLNYWFTRPYYFATSVSKSVWIFILNFFVVFGVVGGIACAVVFAPRRGAPVTWEQSYVHPSTANSQIAEIVVEVVEVVMVWQIDK